MLCENIIITLKINCNLFVFFLELNETNNFSNPFLLSIVDIVI